MPVINLNRLSLTKLTLLITPLHVAYCLMMVTLCCCALLYQNLELPLESRIAKVHPLKMQKSRKFLPLQLQIVDRYTHIHWVIGGTAVYFIESARRSLLL